MGILTNEVDKDDLSALLQVINTLNKIETRQLETDRMFDPLKDISVMLKEYKYEFEPKIYLQVKFARDELLFEISIQKKYIFSLPIYRTNGIR